MCRTFKGTRMEKITVIIPTYNRADTLIRTFKCLEASIDGPEEVIIVDQSNKEDLAQQIKDMCDESSLPIRYIYRKEPSSAAARNVGIDAATHDILVFMDDDVDVKENTFINIRNLLGDSSIAMVGGINESDPIPNSILGYFFGKKSWRKRKIGHVTKAVYGRFPSVLKEQTPTEWCMGFFFVIRKSLTNKWGLRFDEHFKGYCYAEDLDFTYGYYLKSKKEGLRCIMSTELKVLHRISQEYRSPSKTTIYMGVVHREYISYKYFSAISGSRFWTSWSNLSDVFYRMLHKENWRWCINAQVYLLKHRNQIKNGRFVYEDFS